MTPVHLILLNAAGNDVLLSLAEDKNAVFLCFLTAQFVSPAL